MARWHSCNVLQSGSKVRHLWQFSAGSGKFILQRTETKLANEPLPLKIVGRDWQTLAQPKLNIAWLPADQVFLRAVQLPKSDPAETQSMVELQLEKLSPLPTAQIVWGYQVLPPTPHAGVTLPTDAEMQTAVVIIVSRSHVEEFVGQLEGQGYMADRLELPFLDQLQTTKVSGDGAWIYPGWGADSSSCLIAWWYGGILRTVSTVHLPADEKRGAILQEQLAQMNWAGDLEGWLTSPPQYHLVADAATAEEWKSFFTVEQPVRVASPVPVAELAAMTAKRAAGNGRNTNLLPPEFAARYKQQFVDRLWMRGLGAVLLIYVVMVALYLGWAEFARWRFNTVEKESAKLGVTYTNTLQLKERVKILQDQLDLQYAALDCWKATADNLPMEITLDSLNFERGRKLSLAGTAANSEEMTKIQEFNDSIRKATVKNQPLFKSVNAPSINSRPGGAISWNFASDLQRTDAE